MNWISTVTKYLAANDPMDVGGSAALGAKAEYAEKYPSGTNQVVSQLPIYIL